MDNRWQYAGKEAQRFAPGGVFNQPSLSGRGSVDLGLLNFGARMYDPFTARWTAVDPMAKKYVGFSPFAYCGGNPIRIYDPNGNDWRDFVKGLAVGLATNIIPGPSSRRDISGLDNKEDYNSGLKTADVASAAVAGGMIAGGDAGIGAGSALVVGGGTAFATVVAAPEGALAAASGAALVGSSVLLKVGGASIALSTANNAESGYNHGEISSSGNSKATRTSSTTLWRDKGKGGGRIDVKVPGNRTGQIHYQEGHDRNKVTYIYKDGKFYGRNAQTGKCDTVAPRHVNDLLSRPDVQRAIRRGQEYLGL